MFKRIFDLIAGLVFSLLMLPVMVVVAFFIRVKMGSPVLFRQKRPGYMGKPFYLYKFRTMSSAVDDKGNLLHDDIRLTPFGEKLRRLSLDELPQLYNVIRGDLSIVGPRPLLMEYLENYNDRQARRHEVKPGITGWAQVNGRNAISWEEKFELDVWYVENRSFWLDMKILWLTLVKVLRSEGISGEGSTTMVKFMGSKDDEG